jgi:hypothetical protein
MPKAKQVEEEAEALVIPTLVDKVIEEVGTTAGMYESDSIEAVSSMLARLMVGNVPLMMAQAPRLELSCQEWDLLREASCPL